MLNIVIELHFVRTSLGLYEVFIRKGHEINDTESRTPYRRLASYEKTFANILQIITYSRADKIIILGENNDALLAISKLIKKQFTNKEIVNHFIASNELPKEITSEISERPVQQNPFLLGFQLSISGMYSKAVREDGVKHITGLLDNISSRKQEILQLKQNINSSVITVGNAQATGFYLENIQLQKNDYLGQIAKWKVNMAVSKESIDMLEAPFAKRKILNQVLNFSDMRDHIIVTTFKTVTDLLEYNHLVTRAYVKGEVDLQESLYVLKDECMWMSSTLCSREKMIRGNVSGASTFLSAPVCYKMSIDNEGVQLDNVQADVRTSEKCVLFQSDDELNSTFLSIKQNNLFIEKFTNIRNIIRSFTLGKSDLANVSVKFSTPVAVQWNQIDPTNYDWINREYFIFQHEDSFYLYHNFTYKFYQINRRIAEILEAFYFISDFQVAFTTICGGTNVSEEKFARILQTLKKSYNIHSIKKTLERNENYEHNRIK